VVKALTPDSQIFLLNHLGPRLIDVIQRADGLRDILASVAEPRVEERLLELLGSSGLKTLIYTPEHLAGVLEWVYGRCDDLVIALLDEHFLRRLLQTGYEISLVLRAMNGVSQQILIDKLGWPQVASLAHDARDLGHLLRVLSPELGLRLISTFTRDTLWSTIGGVHRLRELSLLLNETEMAAIDRILGHSHAE
jgi:hypothetical protein